jgi:hypothetical protein
VQVPEELVHYEEGSSQQGPSDEPTPQVLEASDEYCEPDVSEGDRRMNRQCIIWLHHLFDNLLAQDREVLAQKSSALDDPTHHRMKHQMNDVSRIQRSSDMEGND